MVFMLCVIFYLYSGFFTEGLIMFEYSFFNGLWIAVVCLVVMS